MLAVSKGTERSSVLDEWPESDKFSAGEMLCKRSSFEVGGLRSDESSELKAAAAADAIKVEELWAIDMVCDKYPNDSSGFKGEGNDIF